MGGGRAWGCVKAMISADQATLLLIGTVETLGCLPPHSNEKPWPPLVSKVTKAYCNCTFSNGVSHARTPTPVMTITIMSLGSTGAFQSSVTLEEGMFVNCCWRFEGCNIVFDTISTLFSVIIYGLFNLGLLLSSFLSFFSFFKVHDLSQCETLSSRRFRSFSYWVCFLGWNLYLGASARLFTIVLIECYLAPTH